MTNKITTEQQLDNVTVEGELMSLEGHLSEMVQIESMSSKQQMDEALRHHAVTLRTQMERLNRVIAEATTLRNETHRELEQTRRALTAFVNV